MARRVIEYTGPELEWIHANSRRQRPAAWAEFVTLFGREDVSLSNYSALCKRNGWFTGQSGRFVKGQGSWNKGERMPFHPNSAATRFKPGMVARNLKPIGDERLCRDGYIEVKVDRVNPYTGAWGHYVHKHRWNWEQVNGPLPKGMALKCLDGNRQNCNPANWVAVPRALLPRLAGGRWGRVPYDQAPAEIRPALLAIAKLEHAARERGKR
jgi:hypothetical protein